MEWNCFSRHESGSLIPGAPIVRRTLRAWCDGWGRVAIVVLIASVAGTAVVRDADAGTMRIMPLGDSITEAEGGFAGYRYWLWHDLIDDGLAVDFVGSMSGVFAGSPRFADYDQDHEGHWGWRADEVLSQIDGWAMDAQPDMAIVHLGTNDIWAGESISETLDELEQIVAALRDVNPQVIVLIAQLIPGTDFALQRIPDFNAEIPALVASLDTVDSPVRVVDQFTGFDAFAHTYDGVHPNESGELRMAVRWQETMQEFLDPPATSIGAVLICGGTYSAGGSLSYLAEVRNRDASPVDVDLTLRVEPPIGNPVVLRQASFTLGAGATAFRELTLGLPPQIGSGSYALSLELDSATESSIDGCSFEIE